MRKLLALALLFCSPVLAQVSLPLRGDTTMTWDHYPWESWGMTHYRVGVLVQGEGAPRIIELPIREWWVETTPEVWENVGWPTAFSPVRELTAIPEDREVCFQVLAHDGQTSGYSNQVCVLWPRVCEFTSQPELLACMGVQP